jgi:transposase
LIQSRFLGAAMFRGDVTDEEWAVIGGLLPPERGRWARPAGDNRRFLNGMLHVLRVGCPWRDMHERYGKWNSVYVRFRRWAEQGVWDAMLQTLVDLGLTDDWQHMIDSTTVRGHVSAAGAKGGLIRRLLVDHAAALRARSMLAVTIKDALLALSSPAGKPRITKPSMT